MKTPKHAPLLLSILSAAGMVATVVTAVKVTPKAVKLLHKESEEMYGDPYAYDTLDAVKICWKCYIPSAIIGTATIVCIFGINTLGKKQQASLVSAYGLMNRAYHDYQRKVKEIHGEEGHRQIMKELAVEKAVAPEIIAPGYFGASSLDFEDADEEPRLFYDGFTGRYFESTISKVLQAEYHLNRNFCLGMIPSLNDFYELLGLKKTEEGDRLGWTNADGDYYWIDFNHYKTIYEDDNLECWVIDAVQTPTDAFLDDL